ncbi:MAG TPA: ATP-binding protein [Syntrophales bacterium]|nr:ATP-binding protein [Syntrophales bacterium]HPQ43517.1 ATP-binding protein [Syntrophales bacterium]
MLIDKDLEKIEIFDNELYEKYHDDPTDILNYMFMSLEASLGWLTGRLEKQSGIKADLHRNGKLIHVDKPIRSVLIQSVQEILMNIPTHAGARKASVSLNQKGKDVSVTIEDDGSGMTDSNLGSLMRHVSPGFLRIHERISHVGGNLSVESKRDQGTRVTITIPSHILKHQQW